MKACDLRKKYLSFFQSKGHSVIKSASLIPDNDPTVLFTTAGMHPLVPYLLGGAGGGVLAGLWFRKVSARVLHIALGLLILFGGARLLLW